LIKLWSIDSHIAKVVWAVSILIITLGRMELLYNLCHWLGWVLIEALALFQSGLIPTLPRHWVFPSGGVFDVFPFGGIEDTKGLVYKNNVAGYTENANG